MKTLKKHFRKAVIILLLAIFTGGTVTTITATTSEQEAVAAEAQYLWPVPSSRSRSRGYSSSHDGQDITGGSGCDIVASKSGTVQKILHGDEKNWQGYGNGVVINHGDGYYTHYAHMSYVSVSQGQYVNQGQKIGGMGATGNATGVHLHFAIATSQYGGGGRINSNPPAPTPSSNWTNSVNSVTTDTLGVKGRVSFSSKKHFSKAGFQIWDSDGNLMKNFSENANWNSSYMDIYYNDVRSEIGVTLKPGTVYTYQYYAVADGQTHYSPKYTKQTNWPGVQNIGEDFYGMIMNESWNPLRVEPNDNIVLGRERNGEWSRLIWRFKRNSDGSYTITSVGDGKAFEVAGADDLDRANVRTWPSNGSNAQKWFIYVVDNKYVFRPACSQTRVLDVQGYSTAEGANIMIYHHHNTSNERFSVYKIQDYTSYSIKTDKSEIKTGQSTGITINDTKYAYNYKLHIVKPDGSEKVVDNGEKNTYTFSETTPGTYKVYAEVKGPINTARGSASDRYCTIKVQSNDTRTGIYYVNNQWVYLKNGSINTPFTGLVWGNNQWYYMTKGVQDKKYAGLTQYNGGWWYIKNGTIDKSFTGNVDYSRNTWYVRNGKVDKDYTGLAYVNGTWWYVNKGYVGKSYRGLVYHNNQWWYVNRGKLDKNFNNLFLFNNKWWYIKNGTIDKSFKGLFKYNGNLWYVVNGTVDKNYNGKVTYNGKTVTVKDGWGGKV